MEATQSAPSTTPGVYSLDNFKALVAFIQKSTDLFGVDNHIPVPMNPASMKQFVESNATKLPLSYQNLYSSPLLKNWDNLVSKIGQDMATMETCCGAVYQRDPKINAVRLPSLNRFQAVVSTIYDTFLDDERRAHLQMNILETTAPLAMFQKSGDSGPFTITYEDINELFQGEVAVVSIPGSYSSHPILWTALGHEVNGHDVLHAEPGLLAELGSKVKTAIGGQLGSLWEYWIDETASDVYGTLFYGPHFSLNLAFFFSALNLQSGETEWMRTTSVATGGQLDPHPTDILRLGVAIGAIRGLKNFSVDNKNKYIKRLEEIRTFISNGVKEVTIESIGKFEIEEMQKIAETVGHLIVTSDLTCFGGLCIQELCTWDDEAEYMVVELAKNISNTPNFHPFHTTAHILAAATMAVLENPEQYSAITLNIESLLDDWYNTNKTWNPGMKKHLMFVRRPRINKLDQPQQASKGLFSFWG